MIAVFSLVVIGVGCVGVVVLVNGGRSCSRCLSPLGRGQLGRCCRSRLDTPERREDQCRKQQRCNDLETMDCSHWLSPCLNAYVGRTGRGTSAENTQFE